jgi:hypothetical protein
MNDQIEALQAKIEVYRSQIINHKVYQALNNIEDLQIFMQFHVYAVWDFMSLLKALQQNLTCVSVPWFPVGDADTRQLINEIVLGEESDVDNNGIQKSHFELYLDAMQQTGANTKSIENFIAELKANGNFTQAYQQAKSPKAAQQFVDFTFNIINGKQPATQAAVFTFGREDLIPKMFYAIVEDIAKSSPDEVAIFKYYLERHIEVDGDHHSNLALQMTSNLCGDNLEKWQQATDATIQALKMRIQLWDGAYQQIMERNVVFS